MAVRQYIGARYVLKIYENSLDPQSADWEAGVAYEPLVMVNYNNSSYISRKEVPASVGNPVDNPTYWALSGLYNGQIASLQQQVNENKIYVTPEEFGAVGDGVADDTIPIQDAINYAQTNRCKVLATKTYLITSALTITAARPYGIEFDFNIIRCNDVSGPALILLGTNIVIKGTSLRSDHDGIWLGDGVNDSCMNSDIKISWLQADYDAIVAKPTATGNVQYINFYIDSIYYGHYGFEANLTNKVVGELNFFGTLFLSITATGISEWAFHIDCANAHAFTGLYLHSCSFEGCNGGIYAENTSGYYSIHPLRMFGCRCSELIKSRNKLLLKIGGTGKMNAILYVDEFTADGFDVPSGIYGDNEIMVYGEYEITDSNLNKFYYPAATVNHGEVMPIMRDGLSLAYNAATTFEYPPNAAFITTTDDLTFNFTKAFAKPLRILCRASCNLILNGSTYPAVIGELFTITGSYMPGVGNRFLLEKVTTGSVHV